MNKQKVVNFYGGPGSGKSTMAARVFSYFKEIGMNVELVTEFAKDMVWQNSIDVLSNQIYIFGKQQHRLWRLKDKVDLIITDAPLLNSIVYSKESTTTLNKLVIEEYEKYQNIDIFLNRVKEYNPKGRHQTIDEAIIIDHISLGVVTIHTDNLFKIDGKESSLNQITKYIWDSIL